MNSPDITERKQAEDALRESEKKYHSLSTIMRLMCDNVPDMIWAKDLKKRFIFANKAICRDLLNAADTDEPIGKTDMFFADRERTRHADDPEWHTFGEICRDTDQITMDAGTPQQFDENGNVQGNYLFLDVRKVPFIDEHGKMIGTVGSARDVTVLKQREAALVESEEKFRMLLLHVPSVAVQGYSMDGTTTYWYDGAENLYGYTAEEAIGKNLIELIIPPEMREDVRKAITYMAKTGQPIPASELSLMRKDGSRVAVFSSHVIIKRSQGEMELYCLDMDLTERKRAEQTLIDAKNYLDLILNTIADPVFVKDGKHRRVLVNDAYCRFLGLPREELIKKSDHDLFPRDQADSLTREDNLVFASGTGQVTEEQVTDMGNQVHTMVTKKTLLVDGQGNKFIVGVARDITERKRTEVALREANRKLTLLSGITRHDINNQLMALMAFLALLEENQPDPTLNGYCRKATTTAQRISAMIRFTEEYEEIGVKVPTWQDCRTLVDTAAKQALPGKVMVKNDLPAGAEVFADPLVVKVFYNLMDNAARYGGKITTIRFSVRESGDDYLIVCEDDGEGIPDEEKEQIFERSFGKNTGLGLFLSREILTITHITIRETGKPGKGARFEITVPKGAYRIAGVQ